MIDTWYAQAALTKLDRAIGFPRDEEISALIVAVEGEIESIKCEETHCDDEHGDLIDPSPARRYIQAKLNRIKMGVYDEERDGNLLTVLEEIERILR